MQTQAEAEHAAESCTLAAAERHAEELYGETLEMTGICQTCRHFVELGMDDQAELYRHLPMEMEGRYHAAVHLRLCLGVCKRAVAAPEDWMGVLYARDNPCDEWEERE